MNYIPAYFGQNEFLQVSDDMNRVRAGHAALVIIKAMISSRFQRRRLNKQK